MKDSLTTSCSLSLSSPDIGIVIEVQRARAFKVNQRGKRAHSTRVRTPGGSCYVVLNTVIAWRSRVGRIQVDSFLDCTRPDLEGS